MFTSATVAVYLILVSNVEGMEFETKTKRGNIEQCEKQVTEIKRNKLIFPHPVIDVYCTTGI